VGSSSIVDELIQLALGTADFEDEERWAALRELHAHGGPAVFDRASELVASDDVRRRVLGADLLSDLGRRSGTDERYPGKEVDRALRSRAVDLLLDLAHDPEAVVAAAAVRGLGQLEDQRGLPTVLDLADHPEAGVRAAVAWALPSLLPVVHEAARPRLGDDAKAVAVLVRLADDVDDDVRDWALFDLGTVLDVDTEEVRALLAGHLDDPSEEARTEALLGLARRGDERAVPVVLDGLAAIEVERAMVEAAAHLGDDRFARPLRRLEAWWFEDPELLRTAIVNCEPSARARRETREELLRRSVLRELRRRDRSTDFSVAILVAPLDFERLVHVAWSTPEGRSGQVWMSVAGLLARSDDDVVTAARTLAEEVRQAVERAN